MSFDKCNTVSYGIILYTSLNLFLLAGNSAGTDQKRSREILSCTVTA